MQRAPATGPSIRPATGTHPSYGSRLPGIEGLRALAAASILVYHVWLYADPAGPVARGPVGELPANLQFGVTLFFALSGFLLYRPFAAALMRGRPRPRTAAYLRNRALRILPAYWVVLVVAAVVLQSVWVRDRQGLHAGAGVDVGALVRDGLFIAHYDPHTLGTGIGPAWSLAVEVVFYLLLPLLAAGAWALARRTHGRGGRRLAALAPAAVLLVLGLSGKATAAFLVPPVGPDAGWSADGHSVVERSFWCQADLFAFGVALAVVRTDWEDGRLASPLHWRKVVAAGASAGAIVAIAGTRFGGQLGFSPYNTLMALVCALVLALVVLPPQGRLRRPPLTRLLEARVLVAGGVISYSLFLWHEPLIWFLRDHGLTFHGSLDLEKNLLVVAALTVTVATLTYRLVESRALALKAPIGAPTLRGRL